MPDRVVPPKPLRRPSADEPMPLPRRFSLSRKADGERIRLVLAGELDLDGRVHLTRALDQAQHDAPGVVLDLEALTSIDAACIGSVYAAAARAGREDGLLTLLEPRGQVRRVLELVGVPDGVLVLDRSDAVHDERVEAAA